MGEIDARRHLPVHTTWLLGAALTWIHVQIMVRPGQDSHAYWAAWQGDPATDMYDIAPGFLDAFNYSPAFAQAVRPLTLLPWPVFGVLWSLLAAAAFVYLLRPLGWRWVFPLLLCCSMEIMYGNVFWLLALAAVLGLGHRRAAGAAWVGVVLTKVTPALGPIWYAVRREWAHLAVSVVATIAVVGTSALLAPGLWEAWADFLLEHEASGAKVGASLFPPLVYRLPVALVLTVYAALTDRRWLVPVAMALATPVAGPAALTMLAAIPRLRLIPDRAAPPATTSA